MFYDTEGAREFFGGDLYAVEATGIVIELAEENHSLVRLDVRDIHRNAIGRVMGAVYFTLADFAFAVAANTGRVPTVTASSQISFLAPAKGDVLYAESRCVKDGQRICFFETEVRDETGTVAARVTTTGCRLGEKKQG